MRNLPIDQVFSVVGLIVRFNLRTNKNSIKYPNVQVSDTTDDAICNFSWAAINISSVVRRFLVCAPNFDIQFN